MAVFTRAHSYRTKFQGKEDMSGPMARLIRVSGQGTRCTDMELFNGLTASNIKDTFSMINDRVTVCLNGKMEEFMTENGMMESNMAKELSSRMMAPKKLVFGRTDWKLLSGILFNYFNYFLIK